MAALSEDAIFDVARQISPGTARSAYLDQACNENQELRARLEALLAAHDSADSPLDCPQLRPTADVDLISVKQTGAQIGPYKLRELIGEGGMGIVYVAEQTQPLKRTVALKVIKPGMDSKAVIARFEAERNALAMMNHPNIAKVLDAGTTDQSLPFFAMELVRGMPITDYCDEHRLSIPQRLELFVQICQAIQHAHQKGIIHRDIKPSNVLVTELDGKPVPKVIDFGVAKALNRSLTDRSVYTSIRSLIGTPLYMSPEQASLSAADVDTRSDIYSLGVLLYELLTGTTPFARSSLKEAAEQELLRIIREDEPPRPSNRISTLGDTASRVSQLRQSEPSRLGRLIRGDLDWIVMKALEKERNRRYETVSAMAQDVTNHVLGNPVAAGPPNSLYRIRKLMRRHRGLVLASAAILLCLIGAVAVMSWGLKQKGDALAREIALKKVAQENLQNADTQRAMIAIGEGNWEEVERLLDRHPQSKDAGFELRLLRQWCEEGCPGEDFLLSANPAAGDISRDGKWLGICQTNGVFCLINLEDGKRLKWSLGRRHFWWLTGSFVTFSPDSLHVAYPAENASDVCIYDLETGKKHLLKGRDGTVVRAAFRPDPT